MRGRPVRRELPADFADGRTQRASVGLAALVAVGAPPASYLLNLGAASELEVDADQIRGVLAAVAPIVGTVRITAAIGTIAHSRD